MSKVELSRELVEGKLKLAMAAAARDLSAAFEVNRGVADVRIAIGVYPSSQHGVSVIYLAVNGTQHEF